MTLLLSILSWMLALCSLLHLGQIRLPSVFSIVSIESSLAPGLPGAALEALVALISAFISSGVTSLASDFNSGSIASAILSAAVSGSNSDSALN
ncbi:MAG: hypothetical protein ACTSRT_04695 [Promethearchaeota archaeon]